MNITIWDTILEVHNEKVDKSFEFFLATANPLVAKHAPLKKKNLRRKPCVIKCILNSINNKKSAKQKKQTRKDKLRNLFKKTKSN